MEGRAVPRCVWPRLASTLVVFVRRARGESAFDEGTSMDLWTIFNAAIGLGFAPLTELTDASESRKRLWGRLEGCWSGSLSGGYSLPTTGTPQACCHDGSGLQEQDVLFSFLVSTQTGLGGLALSSPLSVSHRSSAAAPMLLPIKDILPESGSRALVKTFGHESWFATSVFYDCWRVSISDDDAVVEVEIVKTPMRDRSGSVLVDGCVVDVASRDTCAWPSCWDVPASVADQPTNQSARIRLVLERAGWERCASLTSGAIPMTSVTATTTTTTVGAPVSEDVPQLEVVLAAVLGAVAICALFACGVWALGRRRRASEPRSAEGASACEASADEGSSTVFVSGDLLNIIERGLAEHWVVKPTDLRFEVGPKTSGGFGDVRKAKLMGSSDVAIKLCRDFEGNEGRSSSAALCLKNEIRIFRRIRHPNIVLFFGVTVLQGGALALVLEWVAGGNLRQFVVERRRSGEYEASRQAGLASGLGFASLPEWKLLKDLARGLAYLHSQTPPILHRDLKPANILVEASRPPRAKLTDFGLSVFMAEGREVRARAGTGNYMAPEVEERSAYGIPADIYSFGCVVLFTATGSPPPVTGALQVAMSLRGADGAPEYHAIMDLAIECLQIDPLVRPLISAALDRLDVQGPPASKPRPQREAL